MVHYNLFSLPKIDRNFALIMTGLLLLWLFIVGCNESFEPWEENNQYFFSIYGFLDASADTQWVRVMPVREEFFLDPDRPLDASVTLEHMESGESVIMNDSLFAYAHDVYVWNFWTTMNLQPEQTYRLTAKRPDAPANHFSHAEVTLPPDFPVPVVLIATSSGESDMVFIEGVERLADVQTVYHGRDLSTGEVRIKGISHRQDTSRTVSNGYQIPINPQEASQELVGFPPVFKKQVFVAAAGPDFTDFGTIGDKIAALPEGPSNITNGVGYLGGIVSKTVPYDTCRGEGMALIPCEPEPPPW